MTMALLQVAEEIGRGQMLVGSEHELARLIDLATDSGQKGVAIAFEKIKEEGKSKACSMF